MKIAIFGAGAMGGYLGALLHRAGEEVTLIARGPHLAAMRQHGLTLRLGGEEIVTQPRCTDDPTEIGPQDCVIITLKAHSVPAVVNRLLPLLGPDTPVVTAMNGVPWWYFYRLPGPYQDRRLDRLDPGGRSGARSGPSAPSAACSGSPARWWRPAWSSISTATAWPSGEPTGERSARCLALSAALTRPG